MSPISNKFGRETGLVSQPFHFINRIMKRIAVGKCNHSSGLMLNWFSASGLGGEEKSTKEFACWPQDSASLCQAVGNAMLIQMTEERLGNGKIKRGAKAIDLKSIANHELGGFCSQTCFRQLILSGLNQRCVNVQAMVVARVEISTNWDAASQGPTADVHQFVAGQQALSQKKFKLQSANLLPQAADKFSVFARGDFRPGQLARIQIKRLVTHWQFDSW